MANRALFDTNLFVSYLLSSRQSSNVITTLFDRAFSRDFVLVVPLEVFDELVESISTKPYLATRIAAQTVKDLRDALESLAETTPRRDLEILSIVRDADDDYLVAYAIDDGVDYLVSGDKDLLALGDLLAPLKIRSPQAFLQELDSNPTDP